MAAKKWIPLESNPDVLNTYASKLGLDTTRHAFTDIYGLDEELLAMTPSPVAAVLLLFPITPETEAQRKAEMEAQASGAAEAPSPDVYYMRQTIGNACGTIGVLHAIANARDAVAIAPGSFLETFFQATAGMDAAGRGAYLEHPPEGAPSIDATHQEAAAQGTTAAPPPEEDVDLHFVTLATVGGRLWELDGRKAGPVDHGPSSPETLLADAAAVVRREFVGRGGGSLQFSLIALAPAEG